MEYYNFGILYTFARKHEFIPWKLILAAAREGQPRDHWYEAALDTHLLVMYLSFTVWKCVLYFQSIINLKEPKMPLETCFMF